MSVLERVFPRLAKTQSTTEVPGKVYVAMHWDSDETVYQSASVLQLVRTLNKGRRGPSRLQTSHAWDVVTYRARHHKAWCLRCVNRDVFAAHVERAVRCVVST